LLWVLLGFIGLFVGAFGTLIGAAGGFILVPILLFLYPDATPATITSITLTVAFFNALSGSIAYGRLKRIDYRSGLLFSLAAVPGSVIGAITTLFISRGAFQYIFGAILLLIAGYLIMRPQRDLSSNSAITGHVIRKITDSQNKVYTYSFNRPVGIVIAFGVGFIGGLLGIGGGIMHVPALTQLLSFPAHIATATSHFVVAITAFAAVDTHIITGAFTEGVRRALVLSAGALIGAQFGARFSQRVSGTLIVRLLAVGLAIVALRLLIAPF
jgi:uncharacterized membrane protein YfcA